MSTEENSVEPSDEQRLTAGVARRLGYAVPAEWADGLAIKISRKLTADGVLEQTLTAFPIGYVDSVNVSVKVGPPCARCHGMGRIYTSEGTADCTCGAEP